MKPSRRRPPSRTLSPVSLGVTILAAWASTAGCGHDDAVDPAFAARVVLVEAGADVRSRSAETGGRRRTRLTIRSSLILDDSEHGASTHRVPTVALDVDVLPRSTGDATVTITDVELLDDAGDPDRRDRMGEDLERQSPIGCRAEVSSAPPGRAGVIVDLPVPRGAGATLSELLAHVRQAIAVASVAVPDQPIGAGARWEYETDLEIRGATLRQVTEASLVDGGSGSMRLATEAELRADPQPIALPELPEGSRCDLVSGRGRTRVEVETTFGEALPRSGRAEVDLDMELRVIHDGATRELRTRATIRYEWTEPGPTSGSRTTRPEKEER